MARTTPAGIGLRGQGVEDKRGGPCAKISSSVSSQRGGKKSSSKSEELREVARSAAGGGTVTSTVTSYPVAASAIGAPSRSCRWRSTATGWRAAVPGQFQAIAEAMAGGLSLRPGRV